MKILDAMSSDFVEVPLDATLEEVAALISDFKGVTVVVVDAWGRTQGVVTERDLQALLLRIAAEAEAKEASALVGIPA